MFKLFAFLILLIPSGIGSVPAIKPAVEAPTLTCPGISNLQKTGQTSASISYAWSNAYFGAQYKVWYVRQEDGYTSGYFYSYSPAYTFSGLSAGHYTFYFQALCEGEVSNYVGIEDTIAA